MNTQQALTESAVVVAGLLERLDASREPVDAHQYRVVAQRLAALLQAPDIQWQPLLEQSGAAAAVYENLHYADAGLCCSALESAAAAELEAREAIEAARRMSPPGPNRSEAAEA